MGTLHLPPFILILLVRQSKPIMLSHSSSHTEKLSVAFQASFTGLIWRRTAHQSLLQEGHLMTAVSVILFSISTTFLHLRFTRSR